MSYKLPFGSMKGVLKLVISIALISGAVNVSASHRVHNIQYLSSFLQNILQTVSYLQDQAGLDRGGDVYCPAEDTEFITESALSSPYTEIGSHHPYFSSAVITTGCNIQLTLNDTIEDEIGDNIPVPHFVRNSKILIDVTSFTMGAPTSWGCSTNMDDGYIPFKSAAPTIAGTSVIGKTSHVSVFEHCLYSTTPF